MPVGHILEVTLPNSFDGFRFEVRERAEMPLNAEGAADRDGQFIYLREDVYDALCDNDGRARFTASHELGHFALHTRQPLNRAPSLETLPAFEDSEKQADQFAACLLMPRQLMNPRDDVADIVTRFGVSQRAAEIRLRKTRKA
ncbi:ImmA/IrrE family metallo-endopeptidase [Pyruvatibacter mobilis]|uniref:ImmA/IrrE family metallo-endopeptidase n=1 Tax=Pyruvatibacter mobilis TaxID=1712261 RepID=UPI003BACBEA7